MDNKKSIEDLLGSIYNLVTEAKEEYENMLKKDFSNLDNPKQEILSSSLSEEKKNNDLQTIKTLSKENEEIENQVKYKESNYSYWSYRYNIRE